MNLRFQSESNNKNANKATNKSVKKMDTIENQKYQKDKKYKFAGSTLKKVNCNKNL